MTSQSRNHRRHITVVQNVTNVDANSTVVGIVTTAGAVADADITVTQTGKDIATGATVTGAVITDEPRAVLDPNDVLIIKIAQDQ